VAHPSRRAAQGARKLLSAIALPPAAPVRVGVLGPLELSVGGAPAGPHWARERVRTLLVYLALHGRARREQILDALWPHLDPEAADRNLRVTLTYLHQVLEPDRRQGEATFVVHQDANVLMLAGPPHVELDAADFRTLIDQAEDADGRGLPSVALQLFDTALDLWRGPCLSDVAYEEWAQPAATQLTAQFVAAALRAAELHLAAGRSGAARARAERALEVDGWCEPAHDVLISAALARGQRSEAVRALARCDAMLADLGVAPSPETEHLRRELEAASSRRSYGAPARTTARTLTTKRPRAGV
jgi:DNA-binding SARP family transcriptional activator